MSACFDDGRAQAQLEHTTAATVAQRVMPAHGAGPLTGEVTFVRDGDTNELGAMAIRLSAACQVTWPTAPNEMSHVVDPLRRASDASM